MLKSLMLALFCLDSLRCSQAALEGFTPNQGFESMSLSCETMLNKYVHDIVKNSTDRTAKSLVTRDRFACD